MLIEQYLLYYSAPPHRIGYDQLTATITFMLEHPEATRLYADIYPAIAKQFNTTPACIDHNLRRVIINIWDYSNKERLATLGCGEYRPSNKIFLFALVRRLRVIEAAAKDAGDTPLSALFPLSFLSEGAHPDSHCNGQAERYPL